MLARMTVLGLLLLGLLSPGPAVLGQVIHFPQDVGVHPEEKAAFERLAQHGVTCNVTADGRLLQIFGGRQEIPPDLLACLKDCKAVQSLGLGDKDSHFAALGSLPELPTLKSLGVTHPLIGEVDMGWVRQVPNLVGLNLEAPYPKTATRQPHQIGPGSERNAEDLQQPHAKSELQTADQAVAELKLLTSLYLLRLNRQRVTDAGLAHLVGMKRLGWLELNDTPVTDAGLKHVGRLESLETLYLARTPVTDRGIAHLGQLARLQGLKLDGTAITDQALDTLREFPALRNIRYLYLNGTDVTDAGLRSLADLKALEVLDLSDTRITDAGLDHLAGLKKLYNLVLYGVHVTPEAVNQLKDAVPRLERGVCYEPPRVPSALLDPSGGTEGDGPSPADTPLLKACMELNERRDAASWNRVLGLAAALKAAVDKQLPRLPYTKPTNLAALGELPDASPGRHTLLSQVRYASDVPPGPGESYIHTCAVFINGDLLATSLDTSISASAEPPDLWDGYINNSVVVVNGRVGATSYISGSIVVASGPIAVDGYIHNSLVISLDSLLSFDDPDRPPTAAAGTPRAPGDARADAVRRSEDAKAGPKRPASIFVRNGYISSAVVIGSVDCEDLRDCIVLGRIASRHPFLRGAEILGAGRVARLPWQVDKPQALRGVTE